MSLSCHLAFICLQFSEDGERGKSQKLQLLLFGRACHLEILRFSMNSLDMSFVCSIFPDVNESEDIRPTAVTSVPSSSSTIVTLGMMRYIWFVLSVSGLGASLETELLKCQAL